MKQNLKPKRKTYSLRLEEGLLEAAREQSGNISYILEQALINFLKKTHIKK